ncbi:aldo/keto reductase [Promicromonospora sp. NPDC090134]|uniref:aldo/keto reductase n=1 Tax=Promicromonospora sp. NPDC090134 TaxID=3364408 RepID=UPI0037F7544E
MTLSVAPLVLGTSKLGRSADGEEAARLLRRAAAAGLRDWDTSNNYGRAEEYVGRALDGLDRASVQVFTKVDPVEGSADFSGARVRASVLESLERIGTDRLPLVHLHDPERITFEDAVAPDGPVRALVELRDEGVIEHIGVAGGPVALLQRFVATGEFEFVVTHNRFTLLDRSAEPLLDDCAERGIGVFNAAPFGGGALTADEGPVGDYHYRAVDDAQRVAVEQLRRIAREAGVPLGALALGLGARDPRITATIVGASRPASLDRLLDWAAMDLPDVWADLAAALPAPEHQTGPHGR